MPSGIEIDLIQIGVTAVAGMFGAGVGIGMFRGSVDQLKKDVQWMKDRQVRLRGEDGGGKPMYIMREDCLQERQECSAIVNGRLGMVCNDLSAHGSSIRSLENFARWWMQEKGLGIDEINRILGTK